MLYAVNANTKTNSKKLKLGEIISSNDSNAEAKNATQVDACNESKLLNWAKL